MNELDEGGRLDVGLALLAAGAPCQHHEQGAQALAAAGNDVLGNLVYQRDGAFQACANDPVDGGEVSPNERANIIQSHRLERPLWFAWGGRVAS